MIIRGLIFILLIQVNICEAQHSLKTNKIIRTPSNKSGVVSKSGKLLIDTAYSGIFLFEGKGHKILPPQEVNMTPNYELEYYLVIDTENKLSVFNSNGKKVFGFYECAGLEIDENTKTFVKIVNEADNRLRSYLYDFNGKLIIEQSFENIGYINNSELIALIAEDGYNDEYYLYNIKTKNKLGPFTHFNIYNKDSSPPLGMDKSDFEKYKKLNIIIVRQKSGNENIWGVVDMTGKELLPIKYDRIAILDQSTYDGVIHKANKPVNVNFYFYSYKTNNQHQLLLIDDKLNIYEYDHNLKKISKVK